MALADICGLSNLLEQKEFTSKAFHDEMMINCGNMENNYQLAMPPFANVSVILTSIIIYLFIECFIVS